MATELLINERFQRSINLNYDLPDADRIDHFRPTSKSVRVIKAICGLMREKAFMVIAAYGTGKSIAATYSSHIVMNQPRSKRVVELIGRRLIDVDPELAGFVSARTKAGQPRGIVVALEGYQDNLNESFLEAIKEGCTRVSVDAPQKALRKAASPANMLSRLIPAAEQADIDRICIVWDEFGRHLEQLASRGRASELSALQQLAELVNRQTVVNCTLTLLLHQGLFQYASSLPQSARNEWKKIEGRFEHLQYVDDSREVYQLLGDVIESLRPTLPKMLPDFGAKAQEALEVGLFGVFQDVDDLADTVRKAYPLDPVTLYLLPRLSARVAQNERTLFSFIYRSDLGQPVTPADLYDYFAPAI